MTDGTASYVELTNRLAAAAARLGGRTERFGALDGFPLRLLRFGPPGAPSLLVTAGIHGEEPAAPLGLLDWLEHEAGGVADRLRVTVLPCLNPFGFVRATRGSRRVADLNRTFDDPAGPLTRPVARALGAERFALAMDLHEDCEFDAGYLYELRNDPPFLGERLLARMAEAIPLSDGQVVGPFTTRGGLIRAERPDELIRGRQGWPVALWLKSRSTAHVVTVETPGRRPLAVRAAVHRRLLAEGCAFVLAGVGRLVG